MAGHVVNFPPNMKMLSISALLSAEPVCRNHLLVRGPDAPPRRKWHFGGVILGHAQTCPRSTFSIYSKEGSSDAASASGYDYCRNLFHLPVTGGEAQCSCTLPDDALEELIGTFNETCR